MKLDVAAGLARSLTDAWLGFALSMALAIGLLFLPGSALALDGIDLGDAAEPGDPAACSELVRIKYPFLSCGNAEINSAAGDETWESSRKIPIMSDWTESDGYWGPDLNDES